MSMIICQECGKEFSDKAPACPNCGCPVFYNQCFQEQQYYNQQNLNYQPVYQQDPNFYIQQMNTQQYNLQKKDSVLSVIAAAFSLFMITSFVGFILAMIDLCQNDKSTRHLGSYFSIIFFIICCFGFMLLQR